MHSALREWLTCIPNPDGEGSGRAAQALTRLAITQREARLVCAAAERWARNPVSRRELAVGTLTEAALSEQIGRDVRRQLYDWARSANAAETIHLAVAAVCGGQLARAYPQIAFTRLRHLAVRQNATVQESVFEGLASRPIAELVKLFLKDLDARFREQLISQLRLVFTSYERGDLADSLSGYEHPRGSSVYG